MPSDTSLKLFLPQMSLTGMDLTHVRILPTFHKLFAYSFSKLDMPFKILLYLMSYKLT